MPRLYDGEHAYILQNDDRRIVFVIPYLEQFSLIGTTDREYRGDPAQVMVTEDEIQYLLAVVNRHFKRQLQAEDIRHRYAGVRPLCDDESSDPSAITRDYTLVLNAEGHEPPLLSVFGGKLTTYRKLAEAALAELAPWFARMKPAWTHDARLPGGEDMSTPRDLTEALCTGAPWLPEALARRWAHSYGSRSWRLLHGLHDLADLGEHFGSGLYAREVDYLIAVEWALSVEDILWRRSKLGLFLDAQGRARLDDYLQRQTPERLPLFAAPDAATLRQA